MNIRKKGLLLQLGSLEASTGRLLVYLAKLVTRFQIIIIIIFIIHEYLLFSSNLVNVLVHKMLKK